MSRVSPAAKKGKNVTVTIEAGETETIADITYTCADDGEDCVVTVKDGKVTSTGGTVTAADSEGFTAQGDLEDTEDELEDTQGQLTASQKVRRLQTATNTNLRTASEARRKAEAAPAKATEANKMLSAFQVKGDSETAKASAQKILDAEKDLSDSVVTSVQGAIDALKARKTTAEGLAADAPGRAELIGAIETAIQDAEAHLAAIKKVKQAQAGGAGSVGLLALGIKGADGKGTADTWAEKVAQEMEKAATPWIGLKQAAGTAQDPGLPLNTGGRATAVSIWSNSTRSQAADATTGAGISSFYEDTPKINFKDDVGGRAKTWKEILGQGNVVKKPVEGGVIEIVPFEGMDVGQDLESTSAVNLTGLGLIYKGITGTAYCLAAGCEVTDGTAGAGWYWTPIPDNKNKHWTISVTTGDYEEFTDYAEYGYWMRENDSGTLTHTGYFGLPKNETAMSAAALAANTALGDTAEYRGKALGISILTVADGDNGRKAVKSGEFTANVTLTATFGASPKVEGTVSGFQGPAVNTSWSATLAEGKLLNVGFRRITDLNLVTVENADNGRYSASAYGGTATKRPTGITGEFQAFFPDGRALGGYATRKQ